LRKICKFAAENDKVFGFNLSAPFVLEFYSEDVKFAIEHSDYVFCNEHEASSYAKMHNLDSEDRIGAAKHIASSKKVNQKRQRVSIITVGSLPVIIAIGQPDSKEAEVHTVEVPKIDKDLLVDTNGAGDSFVGGFMAALS
jgi:adenosine kinase